MSKDRIVELQKALRIARTALEKIRWGTSSPSSVAEQALDEMWKLDPKQPLQGIVGHAQRSRT
jgi:hypothetical protein